MQYRKHNVYKNLIAASTMDVDMAWEILVNEINELALDQPTKLTAAITASGLKTNTRPTAKSLSVLVLNNIYTNKALRKNLVAAIAQRHKDPFVNADGGDVGDENALLKAVDDTVADKETLKPADIKKMLLEDLTAKQKQKGLSTGITPIKFLFGAAVVTGIIYLGYKVLYKKSIAA